MTQKGSDAVGLLGDIGYVGVSGLLSIMTPR